MRKKSLYIYIAAFLTILLPVPGRFVYGFTLLFELAFLMMAGIFINLLIEKIKMSDFKTVILMYCIIALTILFRQIMVLLQPEIALTLGFSFYLPPLSLFLIGFLFNPDDKTLKQELMDYLYYVLIFIGFGLIFFLFRDILGFGTFTFYGKKHQIFEVILFDVDKISFLDFFATIPGALFTEGVFLYTFVTIKQKFKVIKNSEVQNC